MFTVDGLIALSGFAVGIVVGLTGMGGGALMTPILVLLFGVSPTAAVASDLAASVVMKPFGALVHMRRRTVNAPLVRWLTLGSVPSAFGGSALVNHLGRSPALEHGLKCMLGGALLLASSAIVAKTVMSARRGTPPGASLMAIPVKPLPTIAIGAVGGFVVGMTSVGSGSLIVVMLMLLYPGLAGSQLVGTDLAQAIPLVGAAALGHLVFGKVMFALTGSLLVGSIPGVFLGAQLSARAPDHLIKPALVVVLVASALKLLGVSTAGVAITAGIIVTGLVTHGLSRRPRDEVVADPGAVEILTRSPNLDGAAG